MNKKIPVPDESTLQQLIGFFVCQQTNSRTVKQKKKRKTIAITAALTMNYRQSLLLRLLATIVPSLILHCHYPVLFRSGVIERLSRLGKNNWLYNDNKNGRNKSVTYMLLEQFLFSLASTGYIRWKQTYKPKLTVKIMTINADNNNYHD